MAQHVYVVNEGKETYEDTFREQPVKIKPGGRIEMQRRDAIAFLGRMSPAGKDGMPVPKMLKMVPKGGPVKEVQKFTCMLDGEEFDNQEDLDKHLKTLVGKTVTREMIDGVPKKE